MSDEQVSQFMSVTGSADPTQAASYLEMSGGNLETAVGLYMEHQGGGGGGVGGGSGSSDAAVAAAMAASSAAMAAFRICDGVPFRNLHFQNYCFITP